MTLKKGIYHILACPCGFSALQQEENPKVYTCEHCGKSRTLDGSPVPPSPLKFESFEAPDDALFKDFERWNEQRRANCAIPVEYLFGGKKDKESS